MLDISSLLSLLPQQYVLPVATAAFGVSTLCSAIDAIFPQPDPASKWAPVRKVVSMVALNLKNAKNASAIAMAMDEAKASKS
jgi:hypothetical protein